MLKLARWKPDGDAARQGAECPPAERKGGSGLQAFASRSGIFLARQTSFIQQDCTAQRSYGQHRHTRPHSCCGALGREEPLRGAESRAAAQHLPSPCLALPTVSTSPQTHFLNLPLAGPDRRLPPAWSHAASGAPRSAHPLPSSLPWCRRTQRQALGSAGLYLCPLRTTRHCTQTKPFRHEPCLLPPHTLTVKLLRSWSIYKGALMQLHLNTPKVLIFPLSKANVHVTGKECSHAETLLIFPYFIKITETSKSEASVQAQKEKCSQALLLAKLY